MSTRAKKNLLPVIASTLVIAALFLGGIYFWNHEAKTIEERRVQSSTATLQNAQSDLSDLEKDLKSIDFNDVN